jgi:natural product precursor
MNRVGKTHLFNKTMKSKFGNFSGKLSREEMKTVVGGGTCGWSGGGQHDCNVSKAEALHMSSSHPDGYWCCDSCNTSSYCGGASLEPSLG